MNYSSRSMIKIIEADGWYLARLEGVIINLNILLSRVSSQYRIQEKTLTPKQQTQYSNRRGLNSPPSKGGLYIWINTFTLQYLKREK